MIKAVLLDVDGTLLDFDACARESTRLTCGELNVPYSGVMDSVFAEVNGDLWRRVERGELTVPRLYEIRWQRIFARLGLEQDGPAFESRFLAHLARSACLVPGAPETVEYLAGKYVLCVASNAPYQQQRRRLDRAGLLPWFGHLFLSERIGAAKPSRAFFEACLDSLPGIGPGEVLMVGDSLTADIAGCGPVGIQSCWFNPKYSPGDPEVKPDFEIYHLSELRRIL